MHCKCVLFNSTEAPIIKIVFDWNLKRKYMYWFHATKFNRFNNTDTECIECMSGCSLNELLALGKNKMCDAYYITCSHQIVLNGGQWKSPKFDFRYFRSQSAKLKCHQQIKLSSRDKATAVKSYVLATVQRIRTKYYLDLIYRIPKSCKPISNNSFHVIHRSCKKDRNGSSSTPLRVFAHQARKRWVAIFSLQYIKLFSHLDMALIQLFLQPKKDIYFPYSFS